MCVVGKIVHEVCTFVRWLTSWGGPENTEAKTHTIISDDLVEGQSLVDRHSILAVDSLSAGGG